MTDKETPQQQPQRPQAEAATSAATSAAAPQSLTTCDRAAEEVAARLMAAHPASATLDVVTLTVAPFTGGPFSLTLSRGDSVEELKKTVAKRLKVLKDRICLLYRER